MGEIMRVVQLPLQKRLDRHFMACAAAAVAVVGAAEQGWAAIQYSGAQNIAVDTTSSLGLYLNFENGSVQNGITGLAGYDINVFSFRAQYPANTGNFYPYVETYTAGGANNKVVGTGAYKASKLASGASIGPAGPFVTSNFTIEVYGNPPLGTYNWAPAPSTGFLGVKFQTSTDTGTNVHFGWVRLNIGAPTGTTGPTDTARYPVTVVDWAWENQANTPILAGATGGGVTPEPASVATLGLLAIGSLGSRAWRKKSA